MPLIKPYENEKKEALRVRLHESVVEELMAYCEWADIKYRDYFIEEACKYIFERDKSWRAYKEENKL